LLWVAANLNRHTHRTHVGAALVRGTTSRSRIYCPIEVKVGLREKVVSTLVPRRLAWVRSKRAGLEFVRLVVRAERLEGSRPHSAIVQLGQGDTSHVPLLIAGLRV